MTEICAWCDKPLPYSKGTGEQSHGIGLCCIDQLLPDIQPSPHDLARLEKTLIQKGYPKSEVHAKFSAFLKSQVGKAWLNLRLYTKYTQAL